MSVRRNLLLSLFGLVVCLLLGVSVYHLSQAQKSGIGATDGSNMGAQAPISIIPSRTGLSSPSTGLPQPQASSEAVSGYKYNAQGQLAAIIYADGSVYTYRYDAHGDKIVETSRSGQTWSYVYDPSHQPIANIDPKGRVTRKEVSSDTVSKQK
jgi:YD repeat-containing protein